MKLPSVDFPTFTIKLISVDTPVKFRPFTVKEEKILLIAENSNDEGDILVAIQQIITNCCLSPIDVSKLPLFDVEYFFLQLRSKSVSNISTVKYRDKEDEIVRDFDIDLDTIVPTIPEGHSRVVKLSNNYSITFNYPTIQLLKKFSKLNDPIETPIEFIANCMDTIVQDDEVFDCSSYPIEAKLEYVNELSTKNFETIISTFVNTIPTLKYELKYVNNNGKTVTIKLEGYRDFF
jgi:hypothetical protein